MRSRSPLGALIALALAAIGACDACQPAYVAGEAPRRESTWRTARPSSHRVGDSMDWTAARQRMVDEQLAARGITDARVLAAMREVPRHELIPAADRGLAYGDQPVDIGLGQTISQPYIVALMTELLQVSPGHKVLEIGTGSGYQAAVLDALGARVFSMEIVLPLCKRAEKDLARLGHGRVQVRCGDGYQGWPEEAPFDRVVLTAAPPELPTALLDQLGRGGRLVAPVGTDTQRLVLVERLDDGTLRQRPVEWVRFVPMVHGAPRTSR